MDFRYSGVTQLLGPVPLGEQLGAGYFREDHIGD